MSVALEEIEGLSHTLLDIRATLQPTYGTKSQKDFLRRNLT